MKNLLILAGLGALAILAGLAAYRFWQTAPQESFPAPELALPTLDGGSARLSDYRGKLVLVNFWATWCPPCLKEIPLLVAAQARHGAAGFQVLGPAMDDPEQVRRMLPRLGIQYPVLIGETQIPAAMDALGDTLGALPYSVLISPEGNVIERKHGEFEAAELEALIQAHLPGR